MGFRVAPLLVVTLGVAVFPTVHGEEWQRAVLRTSQGSITLELDRAHAPNTVQRFLDRQLTGLVICEVRAGGYLVLGCRPSQGDAHKPQPPGLEPPLAEEIDAEAMGLDDQPIDSPSPIDWLWQQEILPHYMTLREQRAAVPTGLEALADAIRTGGTAGMSVLQGKSRLWYLQQLGYRFASGRSAARFTVGSIGTAQFWPGGADERFIIALAPLPERDGRATVFGRVSGGWKTLRKIAALPVDHWHRPETPVVLLGMSVPAGPTGTETTKP